MEMTPDQQKAIALASARLRAQQSAQPDAIDQGAMNFANDMPWYQRFAAGAGKAVADTGLGMRWLGAKAMDTVDPRAPTLSGLASGAPTSRADDVTADIQDARERDAALTNAGPAAKLGNFAGDVALTFLPGGALKAAGWLAKARGMQGAATALEDAGGAFFAPKTVKGGMAAGATFGATQPATDWTERATNIGLGAAGGGAAPALSAGYGALKSAVEPMYNAGRERIVGRALREAAGGDADANAAAQALSGAGELVPGSVPTVGQASGNAGLASLERAAGARVPVVTTALNQRLAEQNAARVAALDRMGGTPGEYDAATAARDSQTGALRAAALDNANYGTARTTELSGAVSDKVAQISQALRDRAQLAKMAGQNLSEAQGQAHPGLDLSDYSQFPALARDQPEIPALMQRAASQTKGVDDLGPVVAQRQAERDFLGRQLDSLQQAGYSPLNASNLTQSITSTLSKPGLRASSVVQKTLGDVKNKLASLADANGNLNAADLYTVRKELGNTIAVHAKDTATWDKHLTAGLQQDIQGSIDDSIRKAGAGDLWDQYLSKYQELSKPINQMDVARAIASKSLDPLTGRLQPRAYARALSDDTAAGATRFGKATLEGTMAPDQMAALHGIRDDLARAQFANDAGRGAGSDTVQKLGYSNILNDSGVPAAIGLLTPGHFGGALVSEGMRRATKGANSAIGQKLADALLNTPEAARIMNGVTPSARQIGMARVLQRLTSNAALAAPGAVLETKQQ